jgi:hypothetical protein
MKMNHQFLNLLKVSSSLS